MAPLHPDQVIARAKVLFDQLRTLQIWEASLTSAAVPELTPLFVTSLDTAWANYAIASIRDARPIYNYAESVRSNLTAILGRTAAYRNREVTWDEMMASTETWSADMKLRW